jgi:hypothetical protein
MLRGALALFLLVLGAVLVVDGDGVFGVLAIAAGVVNVVLIGVLVRRASGAG